VPTNFGDRLRNAVGMWLSLLNGLRSGCLRECASYRACRCLWARGKKPGTDTRAPHLLIGSRQAWVTFLGMSVSCAGRSTSLVTVTAMKHSLRCAGQSAANPRKRQVQRLSLLGVRPSGRKRLAP